MLDTNVVVSAIISNAGPNAQLLDLVIAEKIRPYVTDEVFEEYERVFEYAHLKHLDKKKVATVLRLLKAAAIRVKSPDRLKLSPHESDNRIYECAVAAKAKFIVTENTRHFKRPHGLAESSQPANYYPQ